jgi:trimeric autotransporter adhesin
MDFRVKKLGVALTLTLAGAVLTLSGCGGGGGGGGGAPGGASGPGQQPVSTTELSGAVADGLIQGAKVCYDLNDNAKCDSGEPISNDTGADGKYTLNVPNDQAGKHAVIALVPVGAVDSDTGPVTKAYEMKSPPQADTSKSIFVSPITTIVQNVMVASGVTDPAAAIALVKTQLGMANSPLDNFIDQRSSSDPVVADDARRTVKIAQIVTTVQQEVGSTADAAGVPPAQKEALISVVLVNNLAQLAEAATSVGGSTTTTAVGQQLVSSIGITSATVAVQAQIATVLSTSTPETTVSATPTPFVTVRDFRYTDANNWSYRLFTGDDVVQGDGFKYSNDVRKIISAGVDKPYNRNAAFFVPATNAWYACPSDGYSAIRFTAPNAAGDSNSTYCRTYASTSRRVDESIAGSTVGDVVARIRASGLPTYDTWGPMVSQLANASATFPAGAILRYQISTDTATPDGHNLTDKVRVMKDSAKPFDQWPFAATLDEMVQYYPGNFGALQANGGNTDGIGQIPDLSVTDNTLQKVKNFRVAYQATSATTGNARFYLCRRNATPNTNTNCNGANGQVLLNTTYTIETQADARVMRFAAFPAEVEAFRKFRRLYVERAGAVFYGFKDILQTVTSLRLNQTAWNALRAQTTGVTAHTDPVAAVAVDAASWLRDMRSGSSLTAPNNFTSTFNIRAINSVATSAAGGNFGEVRMQILEQSPGTVTFARNTMYLVGGVWKDGDIDSQCPSNGVNIGTYTNSPRESIFCGVFKDASSGFDADISGRNISATIAEMRLYGSYDNGNDYSTYGPMPTPAEPEYASFNSAVFPVGSKLRYQVTSPILVADAFNYGSTIKLSTAGNPAATSLGSVTAVYTGSTTLAGITGGNTLGLFSYVINDKPLVNTTSRQLVRVAFESLSPNSGNAKFYQCDQSSVTQGPVNCIQYDASYNTTYTIATEGGKNVLRFAGMPLAVQRYGGFARSYVEHGGAVYAMTKNIVGTKNYSQRLNQTAYEAIFNIFGITLPSVTL